MKKPLVALLGIGVIAVGYWLISPLFIDRTVEEELSDDVEAQIDMAIEEFKEGNLEEQLSPEMMDEFMEEMKDVESVTVEEPMPEGRDEPVILSAGSFVSVAHQGTGDAKIIDLGNDDGTILRLQDLDVDNGPDLRVLLSKNADVERSEDLGEYIEVAKLKGNKGTQNYVLPREIDPSEYKSVVIYCKPFHVVFNTATLQ